MFRQNKLFNLIKSTHVDHFNHLHNIAKQVDIIESLIDDISDLELKIKLMKCTFEIEKQIIKHGYELESCGKELLNNTV